MFDCRFDDNLAWPGQGDSLSPAMGKGGAIFIYEHEDGNFGPSFDLGTLQAQSYSGNTCTNRLNDPDINPNYDNANFYVAMAPWPGTKKLQSRHWLNLHRLERIFGWPVREGHTPAPSSTRA